ncbi:MAG: hypothetical protein EON54_01005 [Alcaligenaceae bacterium]|nr:MAG: hypothetical protein EON54_01005 [Alcaligenaceae bacterium]
MLALPEQGINYSVDKHNSKLGILCDWLEASLVFGGESISKSDVIDFLIENNIYISQDFASEFLDSAWEILRRRFKLVGETLEIQITAESMHIGKPWDQSPAYSFCLLLTCASYLYPQRAGEWQRDINTQGSIFEKISLQSLLARYPGWSARRVGWAADNPVRLLEIIEDVISSLCELEGAEKATYVDSHANELGLDVLLYQKFSDSHACFPLFMIQCASGKDWKNKRKTPDLEIWTKVISFNSSPVKGFTMPYAFVDETEFRKETVTVKGLFFERYRLVSPIGATVDWLSEDLSNEINAWIAPLAEKLPLSTAVV